MNNKAVKIFSAIFYVLATLCTLSLFFINIKAGIWGLLAFLLLLTGIKIKDRERKKELEDLNLYMQKICSGNYELAIDDNCEGELSILKNNIYKVILLLRSSNDALKKNKANLADSLADISHQLKTPLTSMTVMCDLLKNEQDEENRKKFLNNIDFQLEKMNWLIITLLKLSKIDAGTVTFKKENYNLLNSVNNAISSFQIIAELKSINIVKKIDENIFVSGDEKWDTEAFSNIIKNCLEHTYDNGMLEISANENSIFTELVIKDNGTGIEEKELKHIFERFYHGKNSSNQSVGIGLALAKTVLQHDQATIDVESKIGQGTTFYIKFYKTIV
mgnify:CR=1 FL=1